MATGPSSFLSFNCKHALMRYTTHTRTYKDSAGRGAARTQTLKHLLHALQRKPRSVPGGVHHIICARVLANVLNGSCTHNPVPRVCRHSIHHLHNCCL